MRQMIWLGGVISCWAAITLTAGRAGGEPAEASSPPPNIVMIFTDDQRHDAVGYCGNHAVQTPHLDRLARQGTVFANCFVNTSICAISRANLLSGQYPGRHGIDDFFKTFSPEQLQKTVPAQLRAAGYQTAFFGKWGIGDTPERTAEAAGIFDYWAGQPMQTCYFHDASCHYVKSDGFAHPPDNLCNCPADARGNAGFRNRIGRANLPNPLHVDADIIPAQVDQFLNSRDPQKPFCLFLFFKSPHSPFEDWDPATAHSSDGLNMPVPPAATLVNAEHEPDVVRKSLGRSTGMRYLREPSFLDTHVRDYYRLITSMDRGVGKIRESLRTAGVQQNTVVLFTSDNGHFLGEHGLAGKWLMYEPALRVPGFLYDPRAGGGSIRNEMVITTDFSVTMLALAGLDCPSDMTGNNLCQLNGDRKQDWRDAFYYDHPYGHGGAIPRTEGVRTERYAYTRYRDQQPPYEQLFDLHADPCQRNNLLSGAGSSETLTLLRRLRQQCDSLKNQTGPVASNRSGGRLAP